MRIRPLLENSGSPMAPRGERDLGKQNIQTKAGMSFRNDKMHFKYVLFPFGGQCRVQSRKWKQEEWKLKMENRNSKLKTRNQTRHRFFQSSISKRQTAPVLRASPKDEIRTILGYNVSAKGCPPSSAEVFVTKILMP